MKSIFITFKELSLRQIKQFFGRWNSDFKEDMSTNSDWFDRLEVFKGPLCLRKFLTIENSLKNTFISY